MSDTIPAPPPVADPRPGMAFAALMALVSTDPTAYVTALANDCASHAVATKALPAEPHANEDFEAWAARACCPSDDDWHLLNVLFQGRYGRDPSDEENEVFEAEWLITAWDAGAVPTFEGPQPAGGMGELRLASAVTFWGAMFGVDVGQALMNATPTQLDAYQAALATDGLVTLDRASRTLCLTEAGQAAFASEGEVVS